ncbi:hypothetical protein T484DRAFT_1777058, partial [Baffinella frigidus]
GPVDCQDVSFSFDLRSTNNARLFASLPTLDRNGVTFPVGPKGTNNARLFASGTLDRDGVLSFTPRDFEFGFAEFRLVLSEQGGLFGASLLPGASAEFPVILSEQGTLFGASLLPGTASSAAETLVIDVLPVNSPPTMTTRHVTIGEVLGQSSAILATALSPGEPELR